MDMRALAKQLKTTPIPAKRVIFETDDGNWVFDSPQVIEANMMGNRIFQVIGKYEVEDTSGPSEDDLKLIMERTNCSLSEAKKTLKETGDIAEAILKLS